MFDKEIGALEAKVEHLEKEIETGKERRREVYQEIQRIDRCLHELPTKEEWATIKGMAKAMSEKEVFWTKLRHAIATKGLLGVFSVVTLYYWDVLTALFKTH